MKHIVILEFGTEFTETLTKVISVTEYETVI